jgi:hypothetical protein
MSLNPDMSNFKADEEKRTASSTVVPDCIQQLPKSEPSSSELTEEQTSNAVRSLVNKNFINLEYPKRVKFRVDPHLPGQTFALVSFIPSKHATPDKQGCFGVLKVRGTFPTMNEADKWAEHLVRNYDSYADIDFVPVGKDFPVMVDNTIYVETTREIDVRKKIEETVKEHIKNKKEEEQREIETIQERQNKLLNEHKEEQQEDMDLDYYTQLRVKKANAQHMLDECHKRMKECNEVIEKTQQQIDQVDEKSPEFKEQYLEKYKKALQAVGADASKNPLIKYMDDSSSSSSSTSEVDRTQPYPTELDFKE